MSWSTCDFRSMPAVYPQAYRRAVEISPNETLFAVYRHESQATHAMRQLRQYRFLVRSQHTKDRAFSQLFFDYKFRSRINPISVGYEVLLRAIPNPTLELLSQLPDLRP